MSLFFIMTLMQYHNFYEIKHKIHRYQFITLLKNVLVCFVVSYKGPHQRNVYWRTEGKHAWNANTNKPTGMQLSPSRTTLLLLERWLSGVSIVIHAGWSTDVTECRWAKIRAKLEVSSNP